MVELVIICLTILTQIPWWGSFCNIQAQTKIKQTLLISYQKSDNFCHVMNALQLFFIIYFRPIFNIRDKNISATSIYQERAYSQVLFCFKCSYNNQY